MLANTRSPEPYLCKHGALGSHRRRRRFAICNLHLTSQLVCCKKVLENHPFQIRGNLIDYPYWRVPWFSTVSAIGRRNLKWTTAVSLNIFVYWKFIIKSHSDIKQRFKSFKLGNMAKQFWFLRIFITLLGTRLKLRTAIRNVYSLVP
jgi:hypothetical protein